MGCTPDGLNINAGVGSTEPEALVARVLAEQADLGIAFDGDGDRVMMVDQTGYLIDGDEIIYMIARDQRAQGKLSGGVVGTLMSNLGLELALQELDVPFCRAKVGDRYVMEMLKERGWRLGGENSGHVIHLDHATTGDGIVAALQVLQAMMHQRCDLQTLRSGMRKFPQVLVNVRFTASQDPTLDADVLAEVARAESELAGRGRVLLRKSGTEPLIRVMVEGEDAALVNSLAQRIADRVKLVP